MLIIEVIPRENGAHRNQRLKGPIKKDGWAVVPEHMTLPESFPFVDIEVKNGVVVSMTAREVPEPEESIPTAEEQLRADVDYLAAMTGVTL